MDPLPEGSRTAASSVKRWVDPSFSELSAHSSDPFLWSKTDTKNLKKRKGGAFSSQRLESDQGGQDESWVDRYSPQSQAELAVHKKKVEDVQTWMNAHRSKGGILVLTGPSGSGKTATVRVLSQELGLKVQEWTNPSNVEPYSSWQNADWRIDGLTYSSQVTQFREFLLRAYKYSCLSMAGDGGAAGQKLILVEDFPNQLYRQPSSLHELLRRFVRIARCPLVFVVSESVSGDGSVRSLFPREIQEELHINCISFNPVAPTSMMKVLGSISAQEAVKSGGRTSVPDQAELEALCSGSAGDIRSAINSLQFLCLLGSSGNSGVSRTKKDRPASGRRGTSRSNQKTKKTKTVKDQEEERAIGGKDAALFLFRALGKILHCKRGGHTEVPSPALPPHLLHHFREDLLVEPEVVVERSHVSAEMFNLYLHQNYLDFFSEVEDVERASEYLSDADLLAADWTNRIILRDYSSSVAVRGILHSNSHQVSVGFRPLHKPAWLQVSTKHRENCLAARHLFRDFCLPAACLQVELLPYLAKLTNPMRNHTQITFIQEVGQMSLRKHPSRVKLETLTDKETAPEEEEEKEDGGLVEGQDQSEEALTASQPKPTLSRALLEDEEVSIEEYSSD
uniref:RAD17 checkpoint clamp loader component n=1 Tax=Oryzias sinensis TaxID=183150 RepID=A0A8C7Z1N6_9TELE